MLKLFDKLTPFRHCVPISLYTPGGGDCFWSRKMVICQGNKKSKIINFNGDTIWLSYSSFPKGGARRAEDLNPSTIRMGAPFKKGELKTKRAVKFKKKFI
jgi:hypothetical protein